MRRLRVALAQINTTVGDLDGNSALILKALNQAGRAGADIVAFPELTVTGYPPEDLVLRSDFVRDQRAALEKIAAQVTTPAAVIGFVGRYPAGGDAITNSAALISQGEIRHIYDKIILPNYGVFDEERYFKSGNSCPVFDIAGIKLGINICEDVWTDIGPAEVQCAAGAEVIININSSPYWLGKLETRRKLVSDLAKRNSAYAVYVNQVGGQDELVFDGGSAVFGPDGNLYVASSQTNQILRYDGETGAFLDVFVQSGAQGPQFPVGLAFGPDGHLYVGSFGNDRILRYDGITGEPLGVAADIGAMGLDGPLFIEFFTGPKCKSDLSEDGVVSAADLLILLGAWGPNAGHPADFDVNGLVAANDLLRLLASWGPCP